MMRLFAAFLLVVGSLSSAGEAEQPKHAPYFGDPDWPRQKVKVAIDDVASCLVAQGPRLTDAFLATPILSKEEFSRGKILMRAHNHCIHRWRTLTVPVPVLRGTIAELRLKERPELLSNFGAMTPHQAIRVASVDGRPFLVSYASCVTLANPMGAANFLRTAQGSTEERSAFFEMGEPLKNCMPENANYHVDLPALRDEVAAVVYLLVVHGQAGA